MLRRPSYPVAVTPSFDPNAPEVNTDAIGEVDQAGYVMAARPEYISDPSRMPRDPLGQSLIGVLTDILNVLLGTYNGRGRPEQINISPGFRGIVAYHTHVRYHIVGIKGSGAAGSRVDILVGTEIIESVYNVQGAPWSIAASFWVDRGQTLSAVDGSSGSVDFSCVLIAVEAT